VVVLFQGCSHNPAHASFTCSIQALLSAPNPDDPLADAVAQHWKSDEPAAIRTGKHSSLGHSFLQSAVTCWPTSIAAEVWRALKHEL